MALLFCDSFDHYTTLAQFQQKWSGTISGSYLTETGRSGSGYAGRPNSTFWHTLISTTETTVITGFAFNITAGNYYYLWFSDLVNDHVLVSLTASTQELKVYRQEAGSHFYSGLSWATLLGTATSAFLLNAWNYLEVKATLHETTGSVVVRMNGAEILNLTNKDTIYTGSGGDKKIRQVGFQAYGYTLPFDDLYICDTTGGVNDTFLGDVRVDAHLPNGAGTTTQWDPSSGSNYQCVDDAAPDDDTTYVSTSTVDEIDTYATENFKNTGATIKAVQVLINAKKADAGTCSIAPVVRPASTDRVGTTAVLASSYAYQVRQVYDVNPEDSSAWDETDFNATEFGVKKIA